MPASTRRSRLTTPTTHRRWSCSTVSMRNGSTTTRIVPTTYRTLASKRRIAGFPSSRSRPTTSTGPKRTPTTYRNGAASSLAFRIAAPLAEQFHNLFQDPTERGVIDVRPAASSESAMLKRLAGWQDVEGAAPTDIEEVISRTEPVDAVAVYDVGQGAATALLSRGVPTLYFDFGGSALGNWRSFPEPLNQFCMTANPPVVLSHWDWDHWSSALRDHRGPDGPNVHIWTS